MISHKNGTEKSICDGPVRIELQFYKQITLAQYINIKIQPSQRGMEKNTIDFCFRDWDTSNSYFGAECKNLYHKRKDKIKRYVDTGVKHYISGKYGSRSSESSIVGYVLSGEISEIVAELISEISKTGPTSNLSREFRYVEPQYASQHTRDFDKQEITIHHLFFDFCHSST